MKEKPIVLSGMRPSGKLHIGHLEGVLEEWLRLQKDHGCFYFVADWHAITTEQDTRHLNEDAIDMVKDWIAYGVDPERSTIFVQSQVPEHSELHLALSMIINLGRLERLPTFTEYLKEIVKIEEKDVKKFDETKRAKVSYGFLGYPVLQAADILLYKTNFVPVGEDQLPHIELTRELARRFNAQYAEVFKIPEAILGHAPRILGTDGRKMSKSYNNVIAPTDDLEALTGKVKRMMSDPARGSVENPGNPDNCSVFGLHEVYSVDGCIEINRMCRAAKLSCVDCKKILPKKIFDKYEQFREKRASVDDSYVLDVLSDGSKKARMIASQTMQEVRAAMSMDYLAK